MTHTRGADALGDSFVSAAEIESMKIERAVTAAAQAKRAAAEATKEGVGEAGKPVVPVATPVIP